MNRMIFSIFFLFTIMLISRVPHPTMLRCRMNSSATALSVRSESWSETSCRRPLVIIASLGKRRLVRRGRAQDRGQDLAQKENAPMTRA